MIIKEHGNDYDLIGCITNRLGSTPQLYNGVFDSVCNAYDCYEDALDAWEKYGTTIKPIDLIAGVCMIFKGFSTWEKGWRLQRKYTMADVNFELSNFKGQRGGLGITGCRNLNEKSKGLI